MSRSTKVRGTSAGNDRVAPSMKRAARVPVARPPQLPPPDVGPLFLSAISAAGDAASEAAEHRRLVALQGVTACANGDGPLAEVFETGLREICRFSGWPAARAIGLAPPELLAWHAADPALVESVATAGFGDPLSAPGLRAHAARSPVWSRIAGEDTDPALARARAAGFRMVLAVPVPVGESAGAMLEFFCADPGEPPDALLHLAEEAAAHLGFRLAREAAAAAHRRADAMVMARGELLLVEQGATLRADGAPSSWRTSASSWTPASSTSAAEARPSWATWWTCWCRPSPTSAGSTCSGRAARSSAAPSAAPPGRRWTRSRRGPGTGPPTPMRFAGWRNRTVPCS